MSLENALLMHTSSADQMIAQPLHLRVRTSPSTACTARLLADALGESDRARSRAAALRCRHRQGVRCNRLRDEGTSAARRVFAGPSTCATYPGATQPGALQPRHALKHNNSGDSDSNHNGPPIRRPPAPAAC
eukprot:scaffold1685_cov390-Prasinococcus_capsulatus_cf.AAC.1